MNRADQETLVFEHAAGHQRAAALSLVFADLEPTERETRLSEALIEAYSTDSTVDLWIARRGNQIVGAMRAPIQPGRTAFVSPAHLERGEPAATALELTKHVVRYLQAQGVQLAQALLQTDHGPQMDSLLESGFRHVSNLLYLVSVQSAFPTAAPTDALEFISYSPAEHNRLARIVERTYQKSLDFPDVEGARDIEDVLAGYRATGVFDPRRWLVVAHQEGDIGCVLLTDHPRSDQWELVYMGLVSEARGQGLGVLIVRHSQWLAQAARKRMVLAVDADNAPAIAAYAQCGFVTWDHRSVLVHTFRT